MCNHQGASRENQPGWQEAVRRQPLCNHHGRAQGECDCHTRPCGASILPACTCVFLFFWFILVVSPDCLRHGTGHSPVVVCRADWMCLLQMSNVQRVCRTVPVAFACLLRLACILGSVASESSTPSSTTSFGAHQAVLVATQPTTCPGGVVKAWKTRWSAWWSLRPTPTCWHGNTLAWRRGCSVVGCCCLLALFFRPVCRVACCMLV